MSLQVERTRVSAVTLANATDLATRIVKNLAGKEVASSIDNNRLTSDAVRCLVVSRLNRNLSLMKPTGR